MNPDQEEEYLLHIAAGTDPITAMAAIPDNDDQRPSGCLFMLLAAFTFSLLVSFR